MIYVHVARETRILLKKTAKPVHETSFFIFSTRHVDELAGGQVECLCTHFWRASQVRSATQILNRVKPDFFLAVRNFGRDQALKLSDHSHIGVYKDTLTGPRPIHPHHC